MRDSSCTWARVGMKRGNKETVGVSHWDVHGDSGQVPPGWGEQPRAPHIAQMLIQHKHGKTQHISDQTGTNRFAFKISSCIF